MTAYEILLGLVQEYLAYLGYDQDYLKIRISPSVYKGLISICLADSNVVIKNKSNKSSHQTHIAITGEAIDFFYTPSDFSEMDTEEVGTIRCELLQENIADLKGIEVKTMTPCELNLEEALITIGKRTQRQIQLSKRNAQNSTNFNMLRQGLYENDLMILLRERKTDKVLVLGIPKAFYLERIPNYSEKYETNTFLRLPYRSTNQNG